MRKRRIKSIYLAGGLFNAAERLHNLYLEKALIALGYRVILPQREALKFGGEDGLDTVAMAKDCQRHCRSKNNVFVGDLDGADSDSGTAVEYGVAITATGGAVVYRTDFRTNTEHGQEVGVNAMFKLPGTQYIYNPCFFTSLEEVEGFYAQLAERIHTSILALSPRKKTKKRSKKHVRGRS